MMGIIKPKYFIPVHGEQKHIRKHAQLAESMGIPTENIFIAESLPYLTNCETEYYNRKLSNEEFLKFWDTREWYMPFYKNTYILVGKE